MNDEAYQWEINSVRERHASLNLSFEQGERAYRFEQERRTGQGLETDHFSYWEEQDYELDHFQQILSAEQLAIYKQEAEASTRGYEAQLARSDGEQEKWVHYYQDLAGYYKDIFIPAWFRDSVAASLVLFMEKDKINYLRAEYRQYNDHEKKRLLIHHYRHNRLFQPQSLQSALLLQECNRLVGTRTFMNFRVKMDAATRAVTEFLLEKYRGYPEHGADFFRAKEAELAAIHETLKARHLGPDPIGGWHTTLTRTPQQINEQHILQLLLTGHPIKQG